MNNPPTLSSRAALRRLLIVVGVAVGVIVYAYGWQVTDIDLEATQDERRQASVQRALQELFAPDLFDQNTESVFADTDFLMNCSDTPPAPPERTDQAYVVISPTCGQSGDIITIEGYNFEANSPAALRWIPPSGESRPLDPLGSESNLIDTDATGHFVTQIEVPSIRGAGDTIHQIEVEARIAVGNPELSGTARLVIEKMVETIFLALMATTVAVPISVVLSFLAAHNLMPQVRIPLGSALIGFILLPIGWFLGTLMLGPVGHIGINWGRDLVMGIVGPAIAMVAYGFGAQAINQVKLKNGAARRTRSALMSLLFLVLVVFTVGAAGGLGQWLGFRLENVANSLQESSGTIAAIAATLVGALGNFVGTLGRLVELGMTFIAAVAGAFLLAWNGMELSVAPLKYVTAATSHILGGVLGLLGGALVMALAALAGSQGALLTLFAPLVAGVLGSVVLAHIYRTGSRRLNETLRHTVDRVLHDGLWAIGATAAFLLLTQLFTTQMQFPLWFAIILALLIAGFLFLWLHRTLNTETLIALVGAAVLFVVTYNGLDLPRSIVNGRLPPAIPWQTLNLLGVEIAITHYLRNAILIGGLLGGIACLLAGIHTAFPVGSVIYNATRTILNALRSIEPLIMGIVFVIWVGIGPFAGVLALTLHSIASLGKLYSEQIESIDAGPIEAILATGANRLQMIVYAVVPQIVPPYIAFTMYRWDINVRMSTIIGFVGGGGIGFLLQQQINLLRYNEAGVAVLAIAIVVSILDYASAYIRERMI